MIPEYQEVLLPAISKGIADEGVADDARTGFATTLQNCHFQGEQLMMGRGTMLAVYTDSSAVAGVFDKFIYDDNSQKYYTISSAGLYSISTAGSLSLILAATGGKEFSDIALFNGDIIAIYDGSLLRYDGTHIFAVSSIYSGIPALFDESEHTDVEVITSETIIPASDFPSSPYYRRLIGVSCIIKKTGTVTGTVKVRLTVGSSTYDSDDVNIDIGVLPTYAQVEFPFSVPVEIANTDTVSLEIIASSGSSGNCIVIAKNTASGIYAVNINGPYTVTGTGLAVYNSRLYVFDENSTSDESSRIYYCDYNNVDDFWSTSSDGMVTYGGYFYLDDNVHSTVKAIIPFKGNLCVSGYSGGKALTEMRDRNHAILTTTTDAVVAKHHLIATPNQLFFIHPATATTQFSIYAWSGNEADLTVTPDLGWAVKSRAKQQWDTGDDLVVAADDGEDMLWVSHGDSDTILIYHIRTGQWVEFAFDITVHALSYVNGRIMVATADGGIYEYQNGVLDTDAEVVVQTKPYRASRFRRAWVSEVHWYIGDSDFRARMAVVSEKGNQDVNYHIVGLPTKPVRIRAKDTGISLKIYETTLSRFTPVGDIACLVTLDGRSNA